MADNITRASGRFGVDWRTTETKYPDNKFSVPDDDRRDILLQEIRQELKKLNALLSCSNFVSIPHTLRQIAKQTRKRKYVRKYVRKVKP